MFSGRFLALIATIVLFFATIARAAEPESADLVERGRYLATASDCTACHTAPNGKPFAGGLLLESPVGSIYSTNITPSTQAGIGGYTEQQFDQALRRGIRADGANLYSAMPYPSYATLTDADISALYAYFMQAVAPVDTSVPRTNLPFPLNIRASMKAWNLLFLKRTSFEVDPDQSALWNRGRYLVAGPAHCGECHTPRGLLEQPLSSKALAGGQVGAWFAPNITSDAVSGIGSWSREEIVRYLRTGHVRGKAQAAGTMGEAVEKSLRYLSDSDLDAIAVYLSSVPAVRDPADGQPRFSTGKTAEILAAFRGTEPIVSEGSTAASAAELFQGNCASCHSAEGQGSRDGYFPSLFHNSALGASNGNNLIATLLNGVNRTTADGQAYMPGFGGKPEDLNALSDLQIARLGNFLLDHFGGQHVVITEQQVAQVRRGGPSSSILLLARAGIAGGVILLLLALWFAGRAALRRKRQ